MKRRNFLKIFPAAGVSSFMLNGYALRPFANSKIAKLVNSCDGLDERTLVLIQLKGGSDGLNVLIPIAQYDTYAGLRPTIGIPDSGSSAYIDLDTTLKDSRRVGLHPAMVEVKDMYDKGWVNIIQGVGYESPNQSHFKSTDLWLSGGDGTPANFNIPSGWMGRSLQALYPDVLGAPTPDMPDPLGIQVGDSNPSLGFHTETEHQNVINLTGQDPAGFYSLVQTIGGAPILNLPDTDHGQELAYIMTVEQSVNKYAQRITDVFNAGTNVGSYPADNRLGDQLKTVARLIRGGSKTKIYLCSLGGFDTHNAQVDSGDTSLGEHADLLKTLSQAVKAFFDDLEAMGIADKVMGCTFSEFGRCAKENGSFGTDHGTLAPMFIFGKPASAGVTGTNVDLSDLTNDNQLKGVQNDYRQVFATLLQDWLGVNNYVIDQTMFEDFAKLPLVGASYLVDPQCYYGGSVTITDSVFNKPAALRAFPSPARHTTELVFTSKGNFPGRLSLHSLSGGLVSSENIQVFPGDNYYYLEVGSLPAGHYVARLENMLSGMAEVVKISVVR
ncbi:MAG: DUF1501 domain-containing protein [Saprospiraceae bacterium]|nr:DUF1501 domain-containing protein [Saprospiraceae bacterium]